MASILIENSNVWVYLVLSLVAFGVLWRYQKDFDKENLIDSFIYLTHKTNLILLFFNFLFMFIFTIVDFTDNNINEFFQNNVKALLYFSFFTYFVFYGLKLIYYMKAFIKENDLFAWAFFKDVMPKEGGKRK